MDNKYSLYRKIRYDRTYRPLGRMRWWRVALGVLLLLSILFFTVIASRPFAARGDFRTAKTLLITPAWLAHYHPEELAWLEAGILYQDGDYEAALAAFEALEDQASAGAMRSLAALRLAEEKLAAGDGEAAAAALRKADASLLSEEEARRCEELRETLSAAPAA